MKKIWFCITLLMLLALTGCTKKYDREDIEEYVKENVGITSFSVSRTRKEITDREDGYTDYLWTVKEKDGTVFHVLDDFYYASEWTSNTLRDDWNSVHLKQYLEEADYSGFTPEEEEDELLYVRLAGTFTSRAELKKRIKVLNKLARGQSEGIAIPYSLVYDFPGKVIGNYEISDSDCFGTLEPGKLLEDQKVEGNYLHHIIDMRKTKELAEFTDQEIHDFVIANPYAICLTNPDGSVLIYGDLLMSRYAYGISFPTVYELLVRNDYPVSGTQDDFSFEGVDGSTYEMADSFVDDGWHYYIKDGEKVQMDSYFYNHVRPEFLKELTGLDVGYVPRAK